MYEWNGKRFETRTDMMRAMRGSQNRANGEAFEFRVLRHYKAQPNVLFAIRSAGSHGLFDLVVMMKTGEQHLITCKINGTLEQSEVKALKDAQKYLPPNNRIKMAKYIGPKKWILEDYKN